MKKKKNKKDKQVKKELPAAKIQEVKECQVKFSSNSLSYYIGC